MGRASVINPYPRFIDNRGINLVTSGTLTLYSNRTTSLASIFSNPALTGAQTNPYTLSATGTIEADARFDDTLSMMVKDSDGAELRTINDVMCFSDFYPFISWDDKRTYGTGEDNIVVGSDNEYYVSIQAANLNKNPTSASIVPVAESV